jgi:hypothetical protein
MGNGITMRSIDIGADLLTPQQISGGEKGEETRAAFEMVGKAVLAYNVF